MAAEGPEARERQPLPGLLPRLRDLRHRVGALLQGQPGGPAAQRGHEAGLDVQVVAPHRPHQGDAAAVVVAVVAVPGLWDSDTAGCW